MNDVNVGKNLITEYKKISELKEEKENLKEYYELLKARREEILALRRIKNPEKRKSATELKKANQELVSLVFQDGLIKKDKNNKSVARLGLRQHDISNDGFSNEVQAPERVPLNRRQYIREDLDVVLPKDFTRHNAPVFTYRNGNDIPRHIEKTPFTPSGNMTRSAPTILEPTLELKPNKVPVENKKPIEDRLPLVERKLEPTLKNIQEEVHAQKDNTPPPVLNSQPAIEMPPIINNIVVQQPSQLPTQPATPTQAAYNLNDTNVLQPDPAIVLDPFDSLKSEKAIAEEINATIPKNSPLFTTTIIVLTVILIVLFFVVIIWGFSSGWKLDPNNFIDSLKSFFWIK